MRRPTGFRATACARRRAPCVAIAAMLACAVWPASPGHAEETPREFPAMAALEAEMTRLVEASRGSVVSVVARVGLEEILSDLGDDVRIQGPGIDGARRIGSGVVLDAEGHILTTATVVHGAREILVVPHNGHRRKAILRAMDPDSGIALLTVDRAAGLKPILLAPDGALPVGSLVTTFALSGGTPDYSLGFVSGHGVQEGPFRSGTFLRVNALTLPGSAGGPVLDTRGRLVGIVFGARGPREPLIEWESHEEGDEGTVVLETLHRQGAAGSAISYAIPVETIRHVADQLIRWGEVRRGWLGVTIESPEPGDVRLTRVVENSPASGAGLRVGDRVLAVDGEPIPSAEILVARIARSSPGDRIRITVARKDDRRQEITVPLGERRVDPPAPRPWHHHERHVARPRLGVRLQPAGRGDEAGLLVLDVDEGSRARAADLRKGDVLIEATGRPLRGVGDLRRALMSQPADRVLEMTILREGQRIRVKVPPPPPPPEAPGAPPPPSPRRERPR